MDTLKKQNLCFFIKKDELDAKDVIAIENKAKEIETVTKEMLLRVKDNFWETWDETKSKQIKFWDKFPYDNNLHGKITANIGKEFLIKNNNFYN